MKKFILFFIFSFTFSLSSFSSTYTVDNEPEKRIEIDMTVTASNGCKFHVTGWVDISIGLFNGISIDGYDVTADGPCGTYTFQGSSTIPPGNDPNVNSANINKESIVLSIINNNLTN